MITFIHGDCLEKMKDLSDNSIDCFVCDLPYGCLNGGDAIGKGKERKRASNQGCSWDIKIDLNAFWTQVKRLARNDNTPVLMFCTTKFGIDLINSNPAWFRYDLVWSKSNAVSFLSANKMPLRSHEMIYVFSKKGAYYKRVDIPGVYKAYSGGTGNVGGSVYDCSNRKGPLKRQGARENLRCAKSVIEVANTKGKGKHPTQKPNELYRWLLERYCPDGGTILDPTAGSFSSCFVAQEMGLNAIGIEKDDTFYKKATSEIISHIE